MVICFEKRGLYTDEEEEKVEGVFSSGTFDWDGVGRMQTDWPRCEFRRYRQHGR